MQKHIDLRTEKGCIEWVDNNILLQIEENGKYIDPFASIKTRNRVVKSLGKELFKMLEESEAVKKC